MSSDVRHQLALHFCMGLLLAIMLLEAQPHGGGCDCFWYAFCLAGTSLHVIAYVCPP